MAKGQDPANVPPVTVLLRHAEVIEAALASRSRGQGNPLVGSAILFALLVAAIWLGHLSAFFLVQSLPFGAMFMLGPYLPLLLPALLCLFAVGIALKIQQRLAERSYLQHLTAIGAPLERDGSYEVTPDALVLHTERLVLAPRWAAIDTVEKGRKGWVVSADQLHFLIPFEAFPDDDAQRPLLAAITARMTPEARARSREAVEFAETAPSPVASGEVAESRATPSATIESGTAVSFAPEASGWLTTEQSNWAASVVYARLARPGFHSWAYPLLAGVTGAVVGSVVVLVAASAAPMGFYLQNQAAITWGGFLLTIALATAGVVWGGRRAGMVAAIHWREALALRGVPDQIEATWQLTPTGLAYRTARFAGEAPYAAIHQVLRDGAYWLIAVDTLTLCIPDTAFASPEDMRSFIAALLHRIDAPARERSARLDELA